MLIFFIIILIAFFLLSYTCASFNNAYINFLIRLIIYNIFYVPIIFVINLIFGNPDDFKLITVILNVSIIGWFINLITVIDNNTK